MKRRDFIAGLGSAAAAGPVLAQQGERVRRIGVLQGLSADDPEARHRTAVFLERLQQAGWIDGRNLTIDFRWALVGNPDLLRRYAAEVVALEPDVILCSGSALLAALLAVTRSIPIVFTIVVDPVGAGFVDSLARPGGNATGFSMFEHSISGKWLELLKEIAPGVTRVGVLREPAFTAAVAQLAALQAVAPSMRVELVPLNVRDDGEIERSIAAFKRSSADGLIVTASPLASNRRELIATLAARHKLPAAYYASFLVRSGGLLSYGPDWDDQFRRAAGYVDRILRGEKPGGLPVQEPTKFELVLNMSTAKALGLTIPERLLAIADEVIQ
jgi:putative tryptophan/tyrosine transport system substrate-binding protein